jgi:hypothetical protein
MGSAMPGIKSFTKAWLLALPLWAPQLLASPGLASPVLPYPEAVQKGRLAAESVLGRTGSEMCLRGKLTNAMVALSSSCDASARKDSLCSLADQVVLESNLTLPMMDEASQQFLKLTAKPSRP